MFLLMLVEFKATQQKRLEFLLNLSPSDYQLLYLVPGTRLFVSDKLVHFLR